MLLFLAALVVPAHAQDPDPVADLTAEVLARHPDLEAARAATEQLRVSTATAGFRPDPVVGIELSNVPPTTWNIGDSPMAGVQLRVSQTVRWPGTSDAQRAPLEARVALGETREQALRRAVQVEVGQALWTLVELHEQEQLLVQHAAALGELESALQARYGVGEAGRSSLWRLELVRDRLSSDQAAIREFVAGLEHELNLLRGRPPETRIPLPSLEALPPPESQASATGTGSHPAVLLDQARAKAATAEAASARQDGRPTASLSAGYRYRTAEGHEDDGTDLVSVGLSVPIGVARGKQAQAREAAALAEARSAERAAVASAEGLEQRRIEVETAWRAAWVRSRALGGELHETATALRETTLSDYRLGQADFDALVEAELQLLNLEHEEAMAASKTRQLSVEWSALTGYPPPPAPQDESSP